MSQYLRALSLGLWQRSNSPQGLSVILIVATCLILPMLVGLVAWLSNMDETTPQLWQMVLAGEMHKPLFVGDYWQALPEALSRVDDIWMFINYPSLAWTFAAMGLVVLVARKTESLRAASALGVSLMLVPYCFAIWYLDMAQLPPKKIGPILAFTLFNVFYMLPVMTLWLKSQSAKAGKLMHV